MSNKIELKQKPIIQHDLVSIGKDVDKRLKDLNIDNLIATVDTVKSIKNLRAELNKELKEYEAQRTIIKKAVLSPYDEFDVIYKTEISEKYSKAISILKDKIQIVENKIKQNKKDEIFAYFEELCQSEDIEFLKFDDLGLDINLSTTSKKYKENINTFVTKIKDDLSLIKATDYEAEILVEYKSTLNVSKAITDVKTRKQRQKEEEERLKREKIIKRQRKCQSLNMVFVDITSAYEYDADNYITKTDIENLPDDEFMSKMIEIESNIKLIEFEKQKQKQKKVESQETNINDISENKISKPISQPKNIIKPPEKKEDVVMASFEVKGTMTQLRALGVYMKTNNITYKNI